MSYTVFMNNWQIIMHHLQLFNKLFFEEKKNNYKAFNCEHLNNYNLKFN